MEFTKLNNVAQIPFGVELFSSYSDLTQSNKQLLAVMIFIKYKLSNGLEIENNWSSFTIAIILLLCLRIMTVDLALGCSWYKQNLCARERNVIKE